ncbi:MAG: alpha-hydroxy-acid oxidizing protein [Actinobacteria bacterium]|nr:alpha-hydroxy-acid oxidizing protein [Actinomycetota bacterium]
MIRTLRSVVRFRRLEWSLAARRLARAADVGDLRIIAKRRLPAGVFDYIDGGAEDELTSRRNRAAYQRLEFRPRVLRDVSSVDPSTTLLGKRVPLPLVLAPTGFTRIADPDGELAVARAAARAGIPYTLSTLATRSIEEVAGVAKGPRWFQVYVWKDRGLVRELIERARAAGFEALMLTVDNAVLGRRDRDVRRGFSLPPKIGLDTILEGIVHPGWTWAFLRAEPISFANVVGRSVGDGSDPVTLADYINAQFDPALSWADIDWMRSVWDGPIVVKGIQCVEDALLAAEAGVDAIALSNHGGRQLDGAPPTLELLPSVVESVGGRIEILCDGGVRRGSDIVKAVALGARGCMAGRAYLYGLGAAGEAGVDHVLRILDADVRRTMALCGVTSVADLTPEFVRRRGSV